MRPIERFLAATRKIAKTPPILESEEYMGFFKQISMGLFNAEFIEVFSTHVFPETIKFKNGQKFIVWDSAYWFIVYNILNLYFLVNHASDDESYTCIENNLEANIYYFLSLMTCDYPALSTEAARGYAELVMKKYEFELSLEQMDRCNNLFSEALYIAKIYCLFHELNHMDYMDDESHLNERTEELAKLQRLRLRHAAIRRRYTSRPLRNSSRSIRGFQRCIRHPAGFGRGTASHRLARVPVSAHLLYYCVRTGGARRWRGIWRIQYGH